MRFVIWDLNLKDGFESVEIISPLNVGRPLIAFLTRDIIRDNMSQMNRPARSGRITGRERMSYAFASC